ncbi:hypothetical protein BJY52DRAFT_1224464 [Lactarius psammicola]|nr:hypothetical protein BJY52DRAFT_1224464 [Lactarius psammicola]
MISDATQYLASRKILHPLAARNPARLYFGLQGHYDSSPCHKKQLRVEKQQADKSNAEVICRLSLDSQRASGSKAKESMGPHAIGRVGYVIVRCPRYTRARQEYSQSDDCNITLRKIPRYFLGDKGTEVHLPGKGHSPETCEAPRAGRGTLGAEECIPGEKTCTQAPVPLTLLLRSTWQWAPTVTECLTQAAICQCLPLTTHLQMSYFVVTTPSSRIDVTGYEVFKKTWSTENEETRDRKEQYPARERTRLLVHPPTGTLGNVSWPNGHQPGVNYAGPYHGRNEANYGDWAQYHNNVWNDGPPPPPAGQYAYQGSTNVGYAPPENAQHHLAAPGPPPVEYHIPPAHGIPNGSHAPPTAMPDVADPHSQNVPNTDPSGTSAMEDLKRLVNRYLHNPDSRVDTLRMELSPSGSRFMIMILLEVDDII